ncbi:hypothetical protein FLONG3_3458 [Fusarium longipes]|uniref:Uncharacterized protein n=1 Tax=Fusarium longipes TaxID=694270 RepID=A0A395T1X8_9HYPO|nr:hypothetical protein FLONG3_3458 [Fusarium longipes]
MRLINVDTLKIQQFFGTRIPPYAILSHRWGDDDEEVSFSDMTNGSTEKTGMAKVIGCCNQAKKDQINYVWIDTCCIDKTSSKELDEAINSMFQWYRRASVCYTYMVDIPTDEDVWDPASKFYSSSWFQRGWTLQELLAPVELRFYDHAWNFIGNKADLASEIENITDIPRKFLLGWVDFHQASVAQRMSWAAKRETKREEDIAYCLLGIFNVTMPMIYGEGGKAFERLQLKIMEQTTDDSIFSWGISQARPSEQISTEDESISAGVFASSPRDFAPCGNIVPHTQGPKPTGTFTVSGGYVHTSLILRNCKNGMTYGMLNCCFENSEHEVIAIPLLPTSSANEYIRPQSHGSTVVETPSVEESSQNIRIRMDRQVRSVQPAAGELSWLHVGGHQKLKLRLSETRPSLEWRRGRALLTHPGDNSTNSTQFLRFSSDIAESDDLVVILELRDTDGVLSVRSDIIATPRILETEYVEKSLEYMNAESRRLTSANNRVMVVTVALTVEVLYQERIYSVRLSRTKNAPRTSNEHPPIVRANAKYWFMYHLERELRTHEAQDEACQDISVLVSRRRSHEATIREIEEEERKLAVKKQRAIDLLMRDSKVIREKETEMKRNMVIETEFRCERRRFQDIIDDKTISSDSNAVSREDPRCLSRDGECVRGPGNWFEKIIQDRLERVPKLYLWPVEAGHVMTHRVPLLWAAVNGKADIAKLLLENGSSIEVTNEDGATALSSAASLGRTQMVKLLLEHGAQLETRDLYHETPLFSAVRGNWTETAALLVDHGADIEARNNAGDTPLLLAQWDGHLSIGFLHGVNSATDKQVVTTNGPDASQGSVKFSTIAAPHIMATSQNYHIAMTAIATEAIATPRLFITLAQLHGQIATTLKPTTLNHLHPRITAAPTMPALNVTDRLVSLANHVVKRHLVETKPNLAVSPPRATVLGGKDNDFIPPYWLFLLLPVGLAFFLFYRCIKFYQFSPLGEDRLNYADQTCIEAERERWKYTPPWKPKAKTKKATTT